MSGQLTPETPCPDCGCCLYLRCRPGPPAESDCGWSDEESEYRCPCARMSLRSSRRLDTAAVLRAFGLRDTLHPVDALAFGHPDLVSAQRSARRNRDLYGVIVHGPRETEAGWVMVTDLTPQIRAIGGEPTDPALPDDYMPGREAA